MKTETIIKMKKLVLFLPLMFWAVLAVFPENDRGWLYVQKASPFTLLRPNDVVLTSDGGILIAYWDYMETSSIIKLSEDGTPLLETTISAQDTSIIISRIFTNGCNVSQAYTAIGVCYPKPTGTEAIITLHLDENLNVTRRKVEPCVGLLNPLLDFKLLELDDGFVVAVTEGNRSNHLAKLDLEGTIMEWTKLNVDSLASIGSLFEIHGREGQFGAYARFASPVRSSGVLVFDDSLQLVRIKEFVPWQSEDEGGAVIYSFCDLYSGTMLPSPDQQGYLLSAHLDETGTTFEIENHLSSVLVKTNNDFAIQDHYEVIGHLNDTIEYPAFYRSMDYVDWSEASGAVYQCSMQGNCLAAPGFPFYDSPLCVIVTKTDYDLNVVWKKRFLTDEVYSPFSIATTTDGGCVVVGMVYDYNNERRCDLFVLKINADGTVGTDEILVQDVRPYAYWPNPAKDELHLHYSPDVKPTQIELYDLQGRLVRSQRNGLESINLQGIAPGTYTMRVALEDGTVFTDKVVKE